MQIRACQHERGRRVDTRSAFSAIYQTLSSSKIGHMCDKLLCTPLRVSCSIKYSEGNGIPYGEIRKKEPQVDAPSVGHKFATRRAFSAML